MLQIKTRFPARKKLLRWFGLSFLFLVASIGLSLAIPGCSIGYLIRSGYFQMELMWSRIPVEEARASGELTEDQLRALDDFADVKAYGREIGLSATENYETVALKWPRQMWNVTACDPVAFEPKQWWFPIVGSVPYLGYFRKEDVLESRDRLKADGYDVYVRSVGAYSTLGWFEDPILPWMLDWPTHRIAQTTLHELTHATVWIPGSVKFNESFANFVGKEAATRYLVHRYGQDGETTLTTMQYRADTKTLRSLLHKVYAELDEIYSDDTLTTNEKLEKKSSILQGIEHRAMQVNFHHPEVILKAIRTGEWNNARLIQFKAYNHNQERFQALLDANDGDLLAFMNQIKDITDGTNDPFKALREATEE